MENKTYWKVEDMAIGDYIEVEVVNKKGDRNLDGMILRGIIKELSPSHNQVCLHTEWCCHTKDKLLKHINKDKMSELKEEKLLEHLAHMFKCYEYNFINVNWKPPEEGIQAYQQIKEKIQKKLVKLHEANIPWIYDIIQIVLENVSCDHSIDHDGAGKTYDDVSYNLDDEEDVLRKCVEAIPEVELKLELDDKFIDEKAKEIVEEIGYRIEGEFLKVHIDRSKDFIRSIVKKLQEKIK